MRKPWKIVAGFMWVLVAGGLVLWLVAGNTAASAEPDRMFKLDNFKLTTETGDTLDTADLHGKPWVAMVFLTDCPSGACPMMVSQMHALLDTVDDPRVRIVSITADPKRDTPEQLTKYANMIGADKTRWIFATGTMDQVRSAVDKLHLVLEPQHDERFLLFDGQNRAVATYNRKNPDEMAKLKKDIRDLLAA